VNRRFSRALVFSVSCGACQPALAQPQQPKLLASVAVVPNARAASRENTRDHGIIAPRDSSTDSVPAALERKPFGLVGANTAFGVADPAARWAFFCQEETSSTPKAVSATSTPLALRQKVDAMPPYLAHLSASIRKVTALLASSDDGRYLVLLSEAQEPQLYDAQTDTISALSEPELDLRADALRGGLRSIAFSPDSSRLALLVRGESPRVVLRDLQRGTVTTVAPVGTNVWRVAFDGLGELVVLQEVLEDTNKNGRLEWPVPEKPLRNTSCSSAVGMLDAWLPTGDAATTTVAPVAGGKAKRVDGFIADWGSAFLAKRTGQGLVLVHGEQVNRLGSDDCDLHILALSVPYGQVLTSCNDKNGHASLELLSPHGSQAFSYDGPTSFADWTAPEPGRFRALYGGVRTYLVDFRLARVTFLQDRDQLLAQGAAGILVRRATQVLLINPDTGGTKSLLDNVRSGAPIALGPGHVVVGHNLLSAELGKLLGTVDYPVMALSANGCVLVALGPQGSGAPFLKGPLQWLCPGS
jgi:hypothetical protein